MEYTTNGLLDPEADHTKRMYVDMNPFFWGINTPHFRGCIYLSHSNHVTSHMTGNYLLLVFKSGSNLSTEGSIPPNTLLIRRCKNFMFRTKLLWNLALLSECINYLIKTVDLELHGKMMELRDKMVWDSTHVEAICAISPSLHCTMGVIVNQISGSHRDYNNTKGVWAMMFLLGNFKGSEVVFSMPGGKEMTTQFQSDDTILIKTWDVVHEIKNYEGDR